MQTGTVTGFLANVPKVSIRGAEGELRWRPLPALQLNADAFGAGAFRSTCRSDGTSVRVAGHVVANLSAAYRIGRWTLVGLVENVADREYFLNSQFSLAGAQVPVGVPGRPRTASPRVRYDF